MSSGLIKQLQISEGVTVNAPTQVFPETGAITKFADDAAYVGAKGSAAANGDIYFNTTDNKYKLYQSGTWHFCVLHDSAETLTNKTIVAGSNTISGLLHGTHVNNPTSGIHGVTGNVVGDTDTQNLSNKTYVSPTIQGNLTVQDVDQSWGANLSSGRNLTIGATGVNVIFPGNFEVQGTTTYLNTAVVEATDANITVNKSGNDSTAQGAGITVERVSTFGSIAFDSALTSKWKIGLLASEVEVADVSSTQTFTNKQLTSPKLNEAVALTATSTELNQLNGVSVGGTSTGDILTIDGAQVITNKDIDGGTASNTNRITAPKDTLANLSGLTRKAGTIFYDTTNNELLLDNGTVITALAFAGASSSIPEVEIIAVGGDGEVRVKDDSLSSKAIITSTGNYGRFLAYNATGVLRSSTDASTGVISALDDAGSASIELVGGAAANKGQLNLYRDAGVNKIVEISKDGSNGGQVLLTDSAGLTTVTLSASGTSTLKNNLQISRNAGLASSIELQANGLSNGLFLTSTTGAESRVYADDTQSAGLLLGARHASGHIKFTTGSALTERMRLQPPGKLKYGTNLSVNALGSIHIQENASPVTAISAIVDDLVLESSSNSGMSFLSGASSVGAIAFSRQNSDAGVFDGRIAYHHSDNTLRFMVNNVERYFFGTNGLQFENGGSRIDHYQEAVVSVDVRMNNSLNTGSISVKAIRIGKQITLVFPQTQLTTNASDTLFITYNANILPAWARPSVDVITHGVSVDNGTPYASPGVLKVKNDGTISYQKDAVGTTFAAGTGGYDSAIAISYTIVA